MPPSTPYDDDDDRRRRDSRDTSLGEKFADLASAIKDRTGEALEDMTDKLKKTKESWEESDRQRDRRYDDDDDRPVFRGNRNYEGVGVGVGEALGDMATAVKRTTDRMVEEAKKSEMVSRLGNQVEQITKDVRGEGKSQGGCFTSAPFLPVATGSPWHLPARAGGWSDDGRGKNTSNMPEGCYCDMRGWTCPLHKGHEKWRQSHVFTQHVVRVRVRLRLGRRTAAWVETYRPLTLPLGVQRPHRRRGRECRGCARAQPGRRAAGGRSGRRGGDGSDRGRPSAGHGQSHGLAGTRRHAGGESCLDACPQSQTGRGSVQVQ